MPEIDTDLDGLSDYYEENIYGTDPDDEDTDSDWIHDGREVNEINTDPLVPDVNDGGYLTLNVDSNVYNYFNDASIYTAINYWTEGEPLTRPLTINLQMRITDHGESGNANCNPYQRTCTVSISEYYADGTTVMCMEKMCEGTITHEMGHVYQIMTTGHVWHNYQLAWSKPDSIYSQECSDDLSDDIDEQKCHLMLATKNSVYMNDYYFSFDDTQSLGTTPTNPGVITMSTTSPSNKKEDDTQN